MSRYTITTLAEVDAVWGKLLVNLIAQQTKPEMIAMMRLAYWYAGFTIAPSYAENHDAASCIALGTRTHVPKMGEGPHEQAHR